jgi:hypothetical protein
MFGCLVRLYKKVKKVVLRAAAVLLRRVDERVRRAWSFHAARVTQDPSYAALTVIVISAFLGSVPPKEALAAVFAALLGVFVNSRQRASYDMAGRDVHHWSDDADRY